METHPTISQQGPDKPVHTMDEPESGHFKTTIQPDPCSKGSENSQPTTSSRPQRDRRPLTHLKDYVCRAITHPSSGPLHESSSGKSHHLFHSISYHRFTPQYCAFLAAITTNNDPQHFSQAIHHPHWRDAMKAEISALENDHTWEFVSLSPNKKVLGCK